MVLSLSLLTCADQRAWADPPANDAFAARTVLTGTNLNVTGSSVGATKEPNEPNHAGEPGGASVWWSWTAPGGGLVFVDTAGSTFDTVLAVYQGDTLSGLSEVASNDDIGCAEVTSELGFLAATGNTYQIAVDGYEGSSGSIQLNLVQSENQPPLVWDLEDQVCNINTALAIPFQVGDWETPDTDLVLTASSSNPSVVSDDRLVLSGSGLSRILTVTPNPDAVGAATITVTVRDGGGLTASQTFVLTVTTPPTISSVSDQTINEDQLLIIQFTASDAESPLEDLWLTVTAASTNNSLMPLTHDDMLLTVQGTIATLTLRPGTNQFGTAVMELIVEDGDGATGSTSFNLTVLPVNDPPAISAIADQTIQPNETVTPLSFEVQDVDTPAEELRLSVSSSNPTLVPSSTLAIAGSGNVRSLFVTPVAGQSGSTTIELTVSDGSLTASRRFVLTVAGGNTTTRTFSNPSSIPINDWPSPASSSTIAVTGLPRRTAANQAQLAGVTVAVNGLSHGYTRDIDMVVVSPRGDAVMLMSDAGGVPGSAGSVTNIDLNFDDNGGSNAP